jgi:tetratricopeptide (TPR) repeat protein
MPGHTGALHTKGLSLGQLSAMEAEDYRVVRAAALAREDEQTQEGLLKIDPIRGSTLNNLAVARSLSSLFLWRAGRVEEACEKMRATAAIGKQLATPGSFTARNLSFWNTVLAECEAERGDPKAAAAALAQSDQLVQRDIKPTSSAFQTSLSQQWRENAQAWVLLAGGDIAGALKHARQSLVAADALDPPNKSAADFKQRLRLRLLLAIANAEYRLGNPAAAEVAARAALATWQPLPRRDFLGSEQQGAAVKTILAQAIARQGRLGEAGEIIRPALKFHQDLSARQREDRQQHFELAHALYVAALVEGDQKSARLAEASAVLDSLPPAMNRSKPVLVVRGWIAEEAKKRP